MEGANLYDYIKNLCLIRFYLSGLEKQDPANITISVLIILTTALQVQCIILLEKTICAYLEKNIIGTNTYMYNLWHTLEETINQKSVSK